MSRPTVDEVLALLRDPNVYLAAEGQTLTRMRAKHRADLISPIQAVPGLAEFGQVDDGPTTPGATGGAS